MSRDDPSQPVGYKNPPRHSRFQKGQSGNPSGRRKAKPRLSLIEELDKLLGEPIQIARNGRPEKISFVAALLRKTAENALKGDAKARQTMFDLLQRYERLEAETPSSLTNEQEEAVIAAALLRLSSSKGGSHA